MLLYDTVSVCLSGHLDMAYILSIIIRQDMKRLSANENNIKIYQRPVSIHIFYSLHSIILLTSH